MSQRVGKSVVVFLVGLAVVFFASRILGLGAWSESVLWKQMAVSVLFWLPAVVAGFYFVNAKGSERHGVDD